MKTILQLFLFVLMSIICGENPAENLIDSILPTATKKYHEINHLCLKVIPQSFIILIHDR